MSSFHAKETRWSDRPSEDGAGTAAYCVKDDEGNVICWTKNWAMAFAIAATLNLQAAL